MIRTHFLNFNSNHCDFHSGAENFFGNIYVWVEIYIWAEMLMYTGFNNPTHEKTQDSGEPMHRRAERERGSKFQSIALLI